MESLMEFAQKQLHNIERDFESEYLFRTCFVATKLVTSPDFIPIRCATMLCHFSELRNDSVVTHFIHFSSTATSSATSEYVNFPESIGQKEEPVSRNEEQTSNKPRFGAKCN